MQIDFYKRYCPLTAAPFRNSAEYAEFAPCPALRPYIRCFWGTKAPVTERQPDGTAMDLVTPDTCMDVIFHVDFTENRITDVFCGMDDTTAVSRQKGEKAKKPHMVSTFAIRFFPWAVTLFSEDSMRGTKNQRSDSGSHFQELKKEMEGLLFEKVTMEERIAAAERFLLDRLYGLETFYNGKKRQNITVLETVDYLLKKNGNVKMTDVSGEIHISTRQLERIFEEHMGVSPKLFAGLMRYQLLWNTVLFQPGLRMPDVAQRFGFTDQSHLNHEFKRFHTLTPTEAKQYAYEECRKK